MLDDMIANAAGTAATEAAMTPALDAILAPTVTDMAITGAGEAAADFTGDALLDMSAVPLATPSVDAAAANATVDAMGNATGATPSVPEQGWMGKTGDFLGSKGFSNAMNLGLKGYGLYQQGKALAETKKNNAAQLAMAQEAHDRNIASDNRRQALNF